MTEGVSRPLPLEGDPGDFCPVALGTTTILLSD